MRRSIYLIGHEFDRDPFLFFKLRGLNRDRLLAALEKGKNKQATGRNGKDTKSAEELPTNFLGPTIPPVMTASLVKRLGNLPFWRGEKSLLDELKPVYLNASRRASQLIDEG